LFLWRYDWVIQKTLVLQIVKTNSKIKIDPMKKIQPKALRTKILTTVLPVIMFLVSLSLNAAWFDRLPTTVTQPDGSVIECLASGDEFFNWLHDNEGFTIIAGNDGYYYYGQRQGEVVVATSYRANSVDPRSIGLEPWALISEKEYHQKRDEFWKDVDKSVKAPHTGLLNSLTVYIRFADQTEFTQTRGFYDNRFNNPGSVSMKNYFWEVSYEQLDIETYHYPVCEMTTNLSYQDTQPRNYYEPYHAVNNPNGYQNSTQRRIREHTLLVNAINYVADQVPPDLIIDGDNDGYVDNVCFIIRGNSGAWADLLWAHRWVLYSFNVFIHGKQVWDYTFQPENQNDVFTLCHEMYHVLGAPDLYHYNSTGMTPTGPWDLMSSGFVHMGAFMKYKYANQNWVTEIPEITQAGTYTLNPLTSQENNAFRIASPNSTSEYFVVEYRRRMGFYENNLPGSGLLVYRINTAAGNGNAQGPPDEVYIYRPNGTPTNNGTVAYAHFSANVNRTAINDYTNPSSFLQNGSPGGLNIFNITASAETISFDILMGTEIVPGFSASATTVPQGGSVSFTDLSTNAPTSWQWTFQGGTPATSTQQNPTVTYSQIGIYPVTLVVSNAFDNAEITLDNYIIVGDPAISVTPDVFNLSLGMNQTSVQNIDISSNGNTWLRYNLQQEYITPGEGVLGEILGSYPNAPASRSGMAWAEGNLYIVGTTGTLNVYDTVQKQVINTLDIHSQSFSIAYDGQLLWIGNTSGTVFAYTLDGEPTGDSFTLPTGAIYTLAWDGSYFIANPAGANNPSFYRLNHLGEIIQTLSTDLEGRATQLVWVPTHSEGQLWASSTGEVVRLQEDENGDFVVIDQFSSPANLSYAIAHDGAKLWWSSTGGMIYRIDDGEQNWLYAVNTQSLLEAGSNYTAQLNFNTLGLSVGLYEAMITIENNDPDNLLIEIPVNLEVTDLVINPGDANCDGIVNVLDVVTTINFILGENPEPFCFDNADVNQDGEISVVDVVAIISIIVGQF
jgi:M6 family metalloprotease-like protein